ncbi:MAG: NAD(P)/FAD-dependent oxidoreductase [Brevinema sp.]
MLNYDIIFIGAGQSAVMGAYEALQQNPNLKVLLIDKGLMWKDRLEAVSSKNKPLLSPIVYGVGGAGAFSDCKFNLDHRVGGDVYTVVGTNIVNKKIAQIVDIYKKLGCTADPIGGTDNCEVAAIKKSCIENNVQLVDTLTMHLGTDGARELYTLLIKSLLDSGAHFQTSAEWTDLIINNGHIEGVVYTQDQQEYKAYAPNVLIAVGRSGASYMQSIARKYNIEFLQGSVDVGVRAEIPDIVMKSINENFYEAKMIYYTKAYNDKMRTFCSNPSGFIAVEKHEDGTVLANGHAYKNKKSQNTNLALLCTQSFTEPFNEPFEYAKSIAKMSAMLTGGKILCQSYGDLLAHRRSTNNRLSHLNILPTTSDYVAGDISLACPKRILDNIIEFIEVHGKITPGFSSADLLLYFPEIKFRSVRVNIDEHMQTSIAGLYVAGDSSGYGSGLNQAAVMGMIAVDHMLQKS